MLSVGRSTIYKLVEEEQLERFKFGTGQTSAVRVTRASVEALLAAGGVRSGATGDQPNGTDAS